MKILIENSTWNNIGDGFYQSTLYAMFKELYPEADVFMEEGPFRRSFRPKKQKYFDNAFKLMDYQKADLHVFSGPMIPQIFMSYQQKIIDIVSRGANYAFISVSGAGVSKEFQNELGVFFKKYPPIFFSSRDEETYNLYKDFVPNAYNGICTAFLVNHYLPVDTIDKKFFISSFYTEMEPEYFVDGENEVNVETIKVKHKYKMFGLPFNYSRHLNFLRPQQENLKDLSILRVHQDLSTHYKHIKFSHPNSFMSFNLLSYLALYKSTEFTVSDRVHSCAVTLAFGKPAKFLYDTPRAGIFDRLGFDYKSNDGIMYPNIGVIDEELLKLKKEIKKYI
jgi:hypothetical protein